MKRLLYILPLSIISILGIVLNLVYYFRYFTDANYGYSLSIGMSITFIIFESALWIYTSGKFHLKVLKISLVIFSILVTLSSQFVATSEKESDIKNVVYEEIDISGDVTYYRDMIKKQDDRIDQIFDQRERDFIFTLTNDSLKNAQDKKTEYEKLLNDLQAEKKISVKDINRIETIYDWYSYDLPRLFYGDVTSDFIRVLFQLFSSIIMALIAPVCLSMIRNHRPLIIKPIIKPKKPAKKRHNLTDQDIENIITTLLFIKGKMLTAESCADKFRIVVEKRGDDKYRAYKVSEIELVRNAIIKQGLEMTAYTFAVDKFNKGEM